MKKTKLPEAVTLRKPIDITHKCESCGYSWNVRTTRFMTDVANWSGIKCSSCREKAVKAWPPKDMEHLFKQKEIPANP